MAARKKAAAKNAAAKKKAPATKKAAAATKQTAGRRSTSTTGTSSTTTTSSTRKPTSTRTSNRSRSASKASTATTVKHNDHTGPTELPKPRFNKDGFGYTKDFDLSFVKEMYELLQEERVSLTGQAKRLEDEAHQLVEEAEMGDVQFDDEGGEGDTMVVERERDLALSAQAREAVIEIDAAIERIMAGTYGYSVVSGNPIPRERLEAIPWSSVLVEEKVGGIGRR